MYKQNNCNILNTLVRLCHLDRFAYRSILAASSRVNGGGGRLRCCLSWWWDCRRFDVRHRWQGDKVRPRGDLLEQPVARTFGRSRLPMAEQRVVGLHVPVADADFDDLLDCVEHGGRRQIGCEWREEKKHRFNLMSLRLEQVPMHSLDQSPITQMPILRLLYRGAWAPSTVNPRPS